MFSETISKPGQLIIFDIKISLYWTINSKQTTAVLCNRLNDSSSWKP